MFVLLLLLSLAIPLDESVLSGREADFIGGTRDKWVVPFCRIEPNKVQKL